MNKEISDSLKDVIAAFAECEAITAIALAGSRGTGNTDATSDYDLYVYAAQEPPVPFRRAVAERFGSRIEIDNRFWETGDEWILKEHGRGVDIMYRTPEWIEGMLARVMEQHESSTGYSTCFWFNVVHSVPLFDRAGWYARLQERANRPFPRELKKAIVAKNFPILRNTVSSYLHQIEVALGRRDFVSVQHRVAAFLASYFDIVFAVNGALHPGEKRLLQHVARLERVPAGFANQVEAAVRASAGCDNGPALVSALNSLCDGIEALLAGGFDSRK